MVKTSFPLQRVVGEGCGIKFLVRELKSQMPSHMGQKKKKSNQEESEPCAQTKYSNLEMTKKMI